MSEGIREVFALSFLTSRKWEVLYNRMVEDNELSLKQLMLLIVVGQLEGHPTIKEVSNSLASSHQNVKALLNQLVKKDFVNLVRDENDKRVTRIHIKEGKEAYWAERDDRDLELMSTLFEGIPREDIIVTARTLMALDVIATKKIKHG